MTRLKSKPPHDTNSPPIDTSGGARNSTFTFVRWHHTTPKEGRAKGIARSFSSTQSKCLRVVIGAYKATATRDLEVEADCAPIDLYLNFRVAKFEWKQARAEVGQLISSTCKSIASRLKRRRGRPSKQGKPQPCSKRARDEWMKEWAEYEVMGRSCDIEPSSAALREWKERLKSLRERARRGNPTRALEATDEADIEDEEWQPRKLHQGLAKAKSSLLIQARTGKIGLKSFLFSRRVPDQATPWCSCNNGRETVAHLVLHCADLAEERRKLIIALKGERIVNSRELRAALAQKKKATRITTWLLGLGKLREYRLALELLEEDENEKREAAMEAQEDRAGQRRKKWPMPNKGRQF